MDTKDNIPENPMVKLLEEILELDSREELESLMKLYQKAPELFILAIDMGCGSTSAAFRKLILNEQAPSRADEMSLITWDKSNTGGFTGELTFDERLKIASSNRNALSMPTIISLNQEKYYIGEQAVQFEKVAENFKCVPLKDYLQSNTIPLGVLAAKKTIWEIWKAYFRLVVEHALDSKMFKDATKNAGKDKILLIVAHPAGDRWADPEVLKDYKELIAEGTGIAPSRIITFSEAKAAMSYVKRKRIAELSWEKGVLVIDLGASTIDVAFYKKWENTPNQRPRSEWSLSMAGKEVDYLLGNQLLMRLFQKDMEDYLKNGYHTAQLPDETFFAKHEDAFKMVKREKKLSCPIERSRFAYDMRRTKEVSSDILRMEREGIIPKNTEPKDIRQEVFRNMESILGSVPFSFRCDSPATENMLTGKVTLRHIVSGDTWFGYLGRFLTGILDELRDSGVDVAKINVVATGGTINLFGVSEFIKDTLSGYGIEHYSSLSQPLDYERTVPFGSIDYFLPIFKHLKEIHEFPNILKETIRKQLEIVPKLLSAESAAEIKSAIVNSMTQWRNNGYQVAGQKRLELEALYSELDKVGFQDQEFNEWKDRTQEEFTKQSNAFFEPIKSEVGSFLESIRDISDKPVGNTLRQMDVTDYLKRFQIPVPNLAAIDNNAIRMAVFDFIYENLYRYYKSEKKRVSKGLNDAHSFNSANPDELKLGRWRTYWMSFNFEYETTEKLQETLCSFFNKSLNKELYIIAEQLTTDILKLFKEDAEYALLLS